MQQTQSLYRAISVLALALLTMGALQACPGGDDHTDTSDNTIPVPTVCSNIAGTWDATEDVTVTCTLAGQPSETDTIRGTGRTTITQNGCAISYVVPKVDVTRTGTIDGQHVRFTGPFALALSGDVQFSQNSVTIEGDLQGNSMVWHGSGMALAWPQALCRAAVFRVLAVRQRRSHAWARRAPHAARKNSHSRNPP